MGRADTTLKTTLKTKEDISDTIHKPHFFIYSNYRKNISNRIKIMHVYLIKLRPGNSVLEQVSLLVSFLNIFY